MRIMGLFEEWSIKLYDDCAELREIISEYPELKEPVVEWLKAEFASNFVNTFKGPIK